MSKIYRRPMFRGGGKVSSYGNGIATGLADGGRPGYETGGDIMSKISGANTLFTGDGGGAKKKIFGIEIPGTGEALDRDGNPYDPKYIQEELNKIHLQQIQEYLRLRKNSFKLIESLVYFKWTFLQFGH